MFKGKRKYGFAALVPASPQHCFQIDNPHLLLSYFLLSIAAHSPPSTTTTTTTPTFIVFFSPSNESLSRQHIFNLFGEHFYDSSFIFKIPAKNTENPEGRNGIKNLNSRHLKLRRVPSFSLEWRTESIENSATHGELSPIT